MTCRQAVRPLAFFAAVLVMGGAAHATALMVTTNGGKVSVSPNLSDHDCSEAQSMIINGETLEKVHADAKLYNVCRRAHPVPPGVPCKDVKGRVIVGCTLGPNWRDPCYGAFWEPGAGWVEPNSTFEVNPDAPAKAECLK